jgi:serine protease Do
MLTPKLRRVPVLSGALMCALALAALKTPVCAAATPMDWSSIIRQVVPSVVNIDTATIKKKDGTAQRSREVGTGFLVDPSGIIVTNKHVIAGGFRITVTLFDRSQWEGKLIAAAELLDLAVLKVDVGHTLPYLKFADSDKAEVGEPVILIGNPLGLGTSVSSGIVSAVHRDLMNTPIDDYIQTDAALNHGNSGGPMIDRAGNVLGVNTILVTPNEGEGSNGLGFAIAGSAAAYAVRHFLQPRTGTVGWIGVHVQDVTPPLQRAFDIPQVSGFVVTETENGSPAAKAGFQFGDVITRYGQVTPASSRELMRDIILTPLGTSVPITFVRNGKSSIAKVAVAQWPDILAPVTEVAKTLQSADAAKAPDFGLSLAPMSDTARDFYRLAQTNAVVVTAVNPTSEAFTNGVRPGDVVLAVQNQAVTSTEQAMRAIAEAKANKPFVALLIASKRGDTRWVALYSGQLATPPAYVARAPEKQGGEPTAAHTP